MWKWTIIAAIFVLARASANPMFTTRDAQEMNLTAVTLVSWLGNVVTPGMFLMSRINLSFLNSTCSQFTSTLDVATQVAVALINTKLDGTTINQQKRYAYLWLNLEIELKMGIEYLTALLLCDGKGGVIWRKYKLFRTQVAAVWRIIRKVPTTIKIGTDLVINQTHFNTSTVMNTTGSIPEYQSILLNIDPTQNNTLIELLHEARPLQRRQPRSPLLIGLGLGFLGSTLLGSIFGSTNEDDIEKVNNKINQQNKLIQITNHRLDILVKNISVHQNTMKEILDKLIANQENSDIHRAIQWNLEKIIGTLKDIKTTFKLSELTLTLLEKGIPS